MTEKPTYEALEKRVQELEQAEFERNKAMALTSLIFTVKFWSLPVGRISVPNFIGCIPKPAPTAGKAMFIFPMVWSRVQSTRS